MDSMSMQRVWEHTSPESAGLSEQMFTQLYQDNLAKVLNFVCYRLGFEEAEDISADIFARLWHHRQDYCPAKGTPETWLWASARNAVTDRLRQRRRMDAEFSEELSLDLPGGKDPLMAVSQQEEWQQIRQALIRLQPIDQEIIAMRFGAGLTNRTIAPILEMSEANVAQHLRRALRKLRRDLQAEGGLICP